MRLRFPALALVVAASSAVAQSPAGMRALDLAPPLRLCVTIPDLSSHAFVGRVAGVDTSSLAIALTDYGTGLSVPWSMVSKAERSMGRNRGASAARGLLLGLAAGTVVYATQIGDARRTVERGWNVLGLQVLSFVLMPGTGAAIGAGSARERWAAVTELPRGGASIPRVVFSPPDEVRLATRDGEVRGTVSLATADTVVVRGRRIAWTDVTGLNVRGGRNRRQGAALGALGLLATAVYGEVREPTLSAGDRPAAFAASAAIGGVLGSLLLRGKGWVSLPIRGLRPDTLLLR